MRVEWPERGGSVVCREVWERRGWGSGAGVAAAAGAVALHARRAAYARVKCERREGRRRRFQMSTTGRRDLCGWSTTRRWRWLGVRGPLGGGWSLCGAAVVAVCGALACACARVVGVCLVIVCRHTFVVVIARTF